jgi:integral membrane sensor domain MASE1
MLHLFQICGRAAGRHRELGFFVQPALALPAPQQMRLATLLRTSARFTPNEILNLGFGQALSSSDSFLQARLREYK